VNCWDCLGIDATREIAAIKRAYATRLKVTRPDDDPQAYQQLRDAFDAALIYAKAPPVTTAPVGPLAENSSWSDPDELAEQTVQAWACHGDEYLLSSWPELKATLAATPLAHATAYSTAFAFAVLDNAKLPLQFVELLKTYFGWGLDFKRQPKITLAELSSLNARLARAEFERKAVAARIEHERKAILAAERDARTALEQRTQLAQQQHGEPMRLVQLLRRQALRGARLAAYLGGAPFSRQWTGLTADERRLLGIDDTVYAEGGIVFAKAGQWRNWTAVGCLLLASLAYFFGGTGREPVSLLLIVLVASYYFPLHVWHEKLRLFFYPLKLVRWWVVDTGHTYSRLFSLLYSIIPLTLALTLSHSVIGPGDQLTAKLGYFIAFMLGCQWLIQTEPSDFTEKLIIPMYGFCLAAAWAIGIADLWILLSVASFWHAASYAATVKLWPWILGSAWTFAMLVAIFYWSGFPVVTLSCVVPYLLFKLARRESPDFVIAFMAAALIFMPTSRDELLALWVGMVALGAGLVSAGLRWAGEVLLVRWSPDPFGLSLQQK